MAVSDVAICNLALQKLGASRISSLSDASKNARECNAAYEFIRDKELRANRWKFAIKRATLAPSSTEPDFTYLYAFTLPTDCLRVLFPARLGLDWKIENHLGSPAILTNDGNTLEIRYLAKVTDPTKFDACFVEALSCKMAWHLAEAITQSNSKKDAALNEYKMAIAEARRMNAVELGVLKQPVDEWLAARRVGQLYNSEWGEE